MPMTPVIVAAMMSRPPSTLITYDLCPVSPIETPSPPRRAWRNAADEISSCTALHRGGRLSADSPRGTTDHRTRVRVGLDQDCRRLSDVHRAGDDRSACSCARRGRWLRCADDPTQPALAGAFRQTLLGRFGERTPRGAASKQDAKRCTRDAGRRYQDSPELPPVSCSVEPPTSIQAREVDRP